MIRHSHLLRGLALASILAISPSQGLSAAPAKAHKTEETAAEVKRNQAHKRKGPPNDGYGWVKNKWASRNKYSGKQLRAIRERNGVGRPPGQGNPKVAAQVNAMHDAWYQKKFGQLEGK